MLLLVVAPFNYLIVNLLTTLSPTVRPFCCVVVVPLTRFFVVLYISVCPQIHVIPYKLGKPRIR